MIIIPIKERETSKMISGNILFMGTKISGEMAVARF
jgi:hypothetical protein